MVNDIFENSKILDTVTSKHSVDVGGARAVVLVGVVVEVGVMGQ